MWSAGSSGGTALEHREWQAEAARCADCRHTYQVGGTSDVFAAFVKSASSSRASCSAFTPSAAARVRTMTPPGLWIRQRLGGRWAIEPTAVCPKCGSRSQSAAGLPRRAIAGLVDRIEQRLPHAWAFWWLVCLFERRGAPEASNGAGQALAP